MPSNINFVIKKTKFKKKIFRPTNPNFFQNVTVNTLIFFFLALPSGARRLISEGMASSLFRKNFLTSAEMYLISIQSW